jgi:PAS domain S-box-containing protein
MIIIELVYNLSILAALCVFSGFIAKRWNNTTTTGKILQGLLFGGVALFGMLNPFEISPGIIFDGRSVVLSLGALFFGPLAGAIAAGIAIIARLIIGGEGIFMGVSLILASVIIGVMFHQQSLKKQVSFKALFLIKFGILVHIVMLLLMVLLPSSMRIETLQTIGITVLLAYPVATVIIGKILHDQEKEAELFKELSASENRFRNLVENAFDAIYQMTGRNYIYANPSFCKLTGYSLEELTSTDFEFTRLLTDKSLDIVEQRYLARKQGVSIPAQYEIEIRDKNGKIKNVEVSTVTIGNNEDVHVMGIIHDITERKKSVEEIRGKNHELRNLNEEKDKLFSIIAHDLRGPFGAFLSLIEIMADEKEELTTEEFRQYARSIHRSAGSVYKLLEKLLDWSRLRRGAIDMQRAEIDPRDLVNECVNEYREAASLKDIELYNHVSKGMIVNADEKMIQSVFRNLLSNAIKFTPRGGAVSLDARWKENGMVEFAVSDNGIGIAENAMEKLFALNSYDVSNGTENEPGTGLGLMICKELVDKHGGCLWAESTEGKGSTFYFTIPALN